MSIPTTATNDYFSEYRFNAPINENDDLGFGYVEDFMGGDKHIGDADGRLRKVFTFHQCDLAFIVYVNDFQAQTKLRFRVRRNSILSQCFHPRHLQTRGPFTDDCIISIQDLLSDYDRYIARVLEMQPTKQFHLFFKGFLHNHFIFSGYGFRHPMREDSHLASMFYLDVFPSGFNILRAEVAAIYDNHRHWIPCSSDRSAENSFLDNGEISATHINRLRIPALLVPKFQQYLELAIKFSYKNLLKLLLKEGVGSSGLYTVFLYEAVDKGQLEMAQLLLDHRARPDGGPMVADCEPLRQACINEDLKMIRLLLQYGANPGLLPSSSLSSLSVKTALDGPVCVETNIRRISSIHRRFSVLFYQEYENFRTTVSNERSTLFVQDIGRTISSVSYAWAQGYQGIEKIMQKSKDFSVNQVVGSFLIVKSMLGFLEEAGNIIYARPTISEALDFWDESYEQNSTFANFVKAL